jgi:hypothetical protein
MRHHPLNAVYTAPSMKRRYEVWFLRIALADGTGAWWFRYLVMNVGRGGGSSEAAAMPAQVWATWFPRDGEPRSFIQGFPLEKLELSRRRTLPFHCRIAKNGIEEGVCWGNLRVNGHALSWRLLLTSQFGTTLSDKGWIGFSRSPHSDAVFSGEIVLDGRKFAGEPLGFGVQGHNCGYRHRTYWRWMHAYFRQPGGTASTLEALVYDLPFGMVFRNAVLWHQGKPHRLRRMEEREIVREATRLKWGFAAVTAEGTRMEAVVEGRAPGIHGLAYTKTNGKGTIPVSHTSLARATLRIGEGEILETDGGAVLEMGGESKELR